jgi:peptide/nickel transport system substrate-binding protein
MLQAGDADFAVVDRSNLSQVEPVVGERADFDVAANKFGEVKATSTADQPLRLWFGVPALTRTDIFLNEAVNIPKEGGIFTGTGTLSSKGIPANFFSDANIRKGFNYAMDWDSYIKDYWQGEAVRLPYVLSLPGELGYDPNGGSYPYDLDKAAAAFKAAALKDANGKTVWDTGFYVIAVYNSGNTARKTWLDILSAGLKKVNPLFDMEVLAVPWAAMLHYVNSHNLPIYNIGWQEDIHDPHNWYSPYLVGYYGGGTGFPADVMATWTDYVNRGVAETDPAKRDAIYKELNQKVYEYCPYILGVLPLGRHYEQRWVNGYYNNPLYGGFYFYELSKS